MQCRHLVRALNGAWLDDLLVLGSVLDPKSWRHDWTPDVQKQAWEWIRQQSAEDASDSDRQSFQHTKRMSSRNIQPLTQITTYDFTVSVKESGKLEVDNCNAK